MKVAKKLMKINKLNLFYFYIINLLYRNMNITFFSIRYYNSQIKIINKKKNFCIYINRCNQYCNSNNPIYCCNCLYLIESEPNLNFHFSDYILINNYNNDYYYVLRNSINNNLNKFNNYYNNFPEEYYYNEDYYSQNYEENEFINNQENTNYNEYDESFISNISELTNENSNNNQENTNYNFDNETFMDNISELTNESLDNQENTNYNFDKKTNINNISKQTNEVSNQIIKNNLHMTSIDKYEFKKQNSNKIIKNNNDLTEEHKLIQDTNKIEKKNDNSNDIIKKDLDRVSVNKCELKIRNDDLSLGNDSNENVENNLNKLDLINDDFSKENNSNKSIKNDLDLVKEDLNEIENSKSDLNIDSNKIFKLSKQEKNKLKKRRKNEKKRLEKIKVDEEKKLLDEMQNLNRINLLEKFNKLGLDEKELKIINSLSYKELSDRIEKPIIYDIKEKLLELYNLKKQDVLLNMQIYDDFKDFELSDKESVDKIVAYLKKSKFNRFYFNSIYELIYFNKLIVFIKDKDNNVFYPEIIKNNNNEVIFIEQILEDEINEYFRDYMIKVLIIPFQKKKKGELKNKYQEYEDKLFKKKVISFEENLLINYLGMNKIGGNMYFGKRGIFKFDKDNNVSKFYYN